jgi:hypothetical protein
MGSEALPSGKEYRLSKHVLLVGLLCTPLFAAMGVASIVISFIDDSIPHPVGAALLFGCFWSFFTALGVWMILAYLRERLVIGRDSFRISDCLRTRQVPFASVSRAVWDALPRGGKLSVFTEVGRVKIYFGNYPADERDELIDFFRESLGVGLQENWAEFEFSCLQQRTDPEKLRASIRRSLRFALIAWAVALPIMYGLVIWLFVEGGFPNATKVAVALFPLGGAVACIGAMWIGAHGDLGRAREQEKKWRHR